MNIVDVIKSQLSGEVLAKLSSLVGENEDKTKAAVRPPCPVCFQCFRAWQPAAAPTR